MSILNARGDSYRFEFGRTFFYPELKRYWNRILNQYNSPYSDVTDYINGSIQSITFPELEAIDTTEQSRYLGRRQFHKNSKLPIELLNREFTVTLKLTEGNINYFIMYDMLTSYLDFSNTEKYLPPLIISILDHDGYSILDVEFIQVIFTSISGFELSKSSVTPDFTTFECGFVFNDAKWHINDGSYKTWNSQPSSNTT